MAGRPENRLDPEAGPVQQLAHELRKLRAEAGSPTYREMARLTGCGASTLSQAAGGTRLPSLPTLRAYVRACGGDAGSAERWERRWREAATGEAAGSPPGADTAAPYRGLRRFEAQDSELYFGREDLVARLVEKTGQQRLVAVVGASGSGKSSLLRAGLIPALRSGRQTAGSRTAAVRILTPGPHPAAQAAARAALLPPAPDEEGDAVVVVDQFEEVFTLCADAGERAAFLDLLLAAARPGGRLRVVVAVRADFFGRCAEHPGLAEALRDATLVVAPMGPAALREAIVRPAAAAGLIVERSLTARIVREAEKEPGSLPLVSHALLETWRRRRGRALTEEMYEAAGGIHGAIAATAESLYARLSPSQAATARRILLRLVTPGDGAQDTRRPTTRAELTPPASVPAAGDTSGAPAKRRPRTASRGRPATAPPPAVPQPVPRAYAAAPAQVPGSAPAPVRAPVSADGPAAADVGAGGSVSAGVAGSAPALVRASSAADGPAAAAGVSAAADGPAAADVGAGGSASAGAPGPAPALVEASADDPAVAAGVSGSPAAEAGGLAAADVGAGGSVSAGVPGSVPAPVQASSADGPAAAAGVSGGGAAGGSGSPAAAADGPAAADVAAAESESVSAADVGVGGSVSGGGAAGGSGSPAGEAPALVQASADDPAAGAAVARDAVPASGAEAVGSREVRTDTDTVLEMLVQARLLTADGDVVDLAHEAVISAWPRFRAWVEEDRERLRLLRHLTEAAAAWDGLDRDPGALYRGSRLAAAWDAFGGEGRAGLTGLEAAFLDAGAAARAYEVRTAARATRRLRALTLTLSFLLVLAVTAGTVAWRQSRVSDAARRAAVAAQQVTLSRQLAAQSASVMSTDTELGMLLAVQAYRVSPTAEATAALYRAAAVPMLRRFTGAGGPVRDLVFSHDGRTLAWSCDDGSVSAAAVADGSPKTVLAADRTSAAAGDAGSVVLAFSSDDRALVSGRADAEARTTDLAGGRTRTLLPGRPPASGQYPAHGVQLAADGRTMAAQDGRDGLVVRDTATGRSRTAAAGWRDLEGLSPDGRVLAAWGTRGTGLWDTATGRRLTTFAGSPGPVVFSGDGHTVALGGDSGGVGVWRWTAGSPPARVFTAADATTTGGALATIALSPDGRLLAAGSADGAVRLWNTATGRSQTLLNDLTGTVTALALGAGGRTLAAGTADGTVRLFDTAGTAPVALAPARADGPRATDVAFAEQGRLLAVGSTDGTVQLWTANPWRRAGALGSPDGGRPVRQVRSTAEGSGILSLAGDGTLRLWDAETRRTRLVDRVAGAAALSADGRTVVANVVDGYGLAGSWHSAVHVWSTEGSQAADPLQWDTAADSVYQFMALSPDGRTMAVRGDKDGVSLVSTATGRTLHSFPMPVKASNGPLAAHPSYPAVAFSPDGRLLAAGGNDGTTWLWDARSGGRKAALTASTSPATAVAFTADTRTLAVAATDGTLRLWDVSTRQVRVTLNTGSSPVVGAAFSPDGTALAAVAEDGSLLTWKVALPQPAAALTAICGLVPRAPTAQEAARYLPRQPLPAACHRS